MEGTGVNPPTLTSVISSSEMDMPSVDTAGGGIPTTLQTQTRGESTKSEMGEVAISAPLENTSRTIKKGEKEKETSKGEEKAEEFESSVSTSSSSSIEATSSSSSTSESEERRRRKRKASKKKKKRKKKEVEKRENISEWGDEPAWASYGGLGAPTTSNKDDDVLDGLGKESKI